MKVILLVHQSSDMYGSDKVLLFLAQGIQDSGHFRPVVVLPEAGALYSALAARGIEVHVGEVGKISRALFTPLGPLRLAWRVFKGVRSLDRIIGERSVAIVHSNTLAVLAGAVWSLLRRKTHLWHVHEMVLSPQPVGKAFPYVVSRLSHHVISNSTATEQWLLSHQPHLASRSLVVFNGLPPVHRPPEAQIRAFRKSVEAGEDDVVVTVAGRINRGKGQELLLKAAAELKRSNRVGAMRFVIVGGPAPGLEHLTAELKQQAAAAGLDQHCHFVPFVDDIWPVWFGTDIAVVPSTHPESFGMVAIEAMAAGVPVIAAGHGGVLDVVVDRETGILYSPFDTCALAESIGQLASQVDLRKRLGTAGARRQKELFSIENQVRQVLGTYRELAA